MSLSYKVKCGTLAAWKRVPYDAKCIMTIGYCSGAARCTTDCISRDGNKREFPDEELSQSPKSASKQKTSRTFSALQRL